MMGVYYDQIIGTLTGWNVTELVIAHPTTDRGNSTALITMLYFLTPLDTTPTSVLKINGSAFATNFDTHKEHQTTSSYS